MLAANVEEFEGEVGERDGGDVLAYGWRGRAAGDGGLRWEKEGFDFVEEGGFAGVVEAEEASVGEGG